MSKARAISKVQQPRKVGRPRILHDSPEVLDKLRLFAAGQHTQAEAAALFGVSLATFEGFLRHSEEARAAWDGGLAHGQASLRRAQWMKAVKEGNTTMQIWLGKQYLGQKDSAHLVNQHELGSSFRQVWAALGKAGAEKKNGT